MRNHNTLKRDAIIKMVAGLVGQPHKVDLKNYDLLITVEIYQVGTMTETKRVESLERMADIEMQNICGASVVDHRFEELKRYNIAEIFDPTPKEEANQTAIGEGKAKEAKAEVDVKDQAAEAVPGDEAHAAVAKDSDGGAEVETPHDVMVEGDGGVSVIKDQAEQATANDEGVVSAVKD